MKITKRILAIILALAMTVGGLTIASVADWDGGYLIEPEEVRYYAGAYKYPEDEPEEESVPYYSEYIAEGEGEAAEGIAPALIGIVPFSTPVDWDTSTPPTLVGSEYTVILSGAPSNVLQIPAGATVTITSTGTVTTFWPNILSINIPANSTVIWTADIFSNEIHGNSLVDIHGDGTFNMVGGSIESGGAVGRAISSHDSLTINISGNARVVSNTNDGIAINGLNLSVNISGGEIRAEDIAIIGGGNVTMSGGTVQARFPLRTFGADITVTGGTVISPYNYGVALSSGGGNVTVSGGTIRSYGEPSHGLFSYGGNITVDGGSISVTGQGNSTAIAIEPQTFLSNVGSITVSGGTIQIHGANSTALRSFEGDIVVDGGLVSATGQGSTAIRADSIACSVSIVGSGTVFGIGNSLSDIIDSSAAPTIGGNGVVIWWTGTGSPFAVNTSTNLHTNPASATAHWAAPNLVLYTNGANSGNFAVPGVTVTAQRQPSPPSQQPQPPQQPSGTITGGSDNDDRGRGGSGVSRVLSTLIPTPQEIWLTPQMAASLTQTAAADGANFTRSRHDGRYGVRAAAWLNLAGRRFDHDATANRAVQVRVSILNPAQMTEDMLVSAWVAGNDVSRVRGIFERWFSNDVRVVHFDHSGPWGQNVWVAARVDLTGMDVGNLHFYSYDRETHSFRWISEPNHRIDSNGFLHFRVDVGGAIVISDGQLMRR